MLSPTSDGRFAIARLGLLLYTHVIWPLAARRPRGSERAAACTALRRVDRPSAGASDTTSLVLGRRASRPLNGRPPPLCVHSL